jgi:hypothetical protein
LKEFFNRHPGRIAIFVTMGSLLLHLALSLGTGLAPDEAYYWTWSLSPQGGYFDHPPLIAWIIRGCTDLFGVNVFAIRFFPLISTIMLSFMLYWAGKTLLRDRWAGLWSVVLINVTILFSAGGFLMTPDTPEVVLYFWAALAFYRGITENRKGIILFSGLLFGLGLLAKYPMILLLPEIGLYLLLVPQRRKWIYSPVVLLAVGIAFLVFLPDVLWNKNHGWASYLFQWHHGMGLHQSPAWQTVPDYLGGQLLMLTPGIFLMILAAGWRGFSRWVSGKISDPELYLWLISYPVLFFFGYSALHGKVEANWAVEGYLGAFVILGALIPRWLEATERLRKTVLFSVGLGCFMVGLVSVQALVPVIPLNPQRDPTGRLHGYRLLDREIREVIGSLPSGSRPAGWISDGYTNTGELKFLEYGRTPVYQVHPVRHFRTTEITANQAQGLLGKPVLLVQNGPHGHFFEELSGKWGEPVYLKTLEIPRRGALSSLPILEVDLYLIPSFKNPFGAGKSAS